MVTFDPLVRCGRRLVAARLFAMLIRHSGFDFVVAHTTAAGFQLRNQLFMTCDQPFMSGNRFFVLLKRFDFGSKCRFEIRQESSLLLLPFFDILPPHRNIRLPTQMIRVQNLVVLSAHRIYPIDRLG